MNEYFFLLHHGFLSPRADEIARRHGAWHVNYREPRGARRGWFACPNRGAPFDGAVANAVRAEIDALGGMDALRVRR